MVVFLLMVQCDHKGETGKETIPFLKKNGEITQLIVVINHF